MYDAVLRPNGVRCTLLDNIAPQLGTFVDTDGHTKANRLFDNVGVQYGLSALRTGVITPEDFVRLNEGIGSYSADLVWSGPTAPGSPAKRITSTVDGLETAYGAGLVVDGKQLAKVAIIDLRGDQNPAGDIHSNWRSWGQRERLDHANGHHGNQVIWATATGGRSPALARRLREELDERFGPEWEEAVRLLGEVRDRTRAALPDVTERARRWRRALDVEELLELIRSGQADEARRRLVERLTAPAPAGAVR